MTTRLSRVVATLLLLTPAFGLSLSRPSRSRSHRAVALASDNTTAETGNQTSFKGRPKKGRLPKSNGPVVPTADLKECPPMPQTPQEWESSYLWAVFFDGKDALKGPHVYDWDKNFFYKVSALLTQIYAQEQTEIGKQPLDIRMVEKFRGLTYENHDYNEICVNAVTGKRVSKKEKNQAKAEGRKIPTSCKNGDGGHEIMPRCTDKMTCPEVQALLMHMPTYLYKGNPDPSHTPGCYRGLHAHTEGNLKEVLRRLINDYNTDIQAKVQANATKDELLEGLTKFARAFAFLHPFKNGNGRLRNILVQREIRRLGIGCGTMMYNYNKDAFVDGYDRYVAKLRDGLEKFKWGIENQQNPWLNNATLLEHEKKFETITGLEACASSEKFGSGGTINKKK